MCHEVTVACYCSPEPVEGSGTIFHLEGLCSVLCRVFMAVERGVVPPCWSCCNVVMTVPILKPAQLNISVTSDDEYPKISHHDSRLLRFHLLLF